jgi:excisionase family DNA binding protein
MPSEFPSSDRPSSGPGDASAGPGPDRLLTPGEVAELFRVNPKTVTRWARAGKLSAIRTLGGHRRFRASEVRRFLGELTAEAPPRS